jgi:hypothetical protein
LNRVIKKYSLLVGKLTLSLLIFILVFLKVTQGQVVNLLSIISFRLILIICITSIIQISINAAIQRKLLSIYDICLRFKEVIVHNVISGIYVILIPGFIAPDFYLGYQYSKGNKNYGRVVSALFLNRSIGFVTSTFLTLVAIIILGPGLIEKIQMGEGLISRSLLIFFPLILAVFISIVGFAFKTRISKVLKLISNIWDETVRNKLTVLCTMSLKLGFNLVGLTGRILLGYTVGINLPLIEFAAIILVLNFLISLPISINGVGVREAGYVGLLSLLGVPSATAFLFALCEFGISLFGIILGGLFFFGSNITRYLRVDSSK